MFSLEFSISSSNNNTVHQIFTFIAKDVFLNVRITNIPLLKTVEHSWIGIDCVLLHINNKKNWKTFHTIPTFCSQWTKTLYHISWNILNRISFPKLRTYFFWQRSLDYCFERPQTISWLFHFEKKPASTFSFYLKGKNRISKTLCFLHNRKKSSCSWYVQPFFYLSKSATESIKTQTSSFASSFCITDSQKTTQGNAIFV